MASNNPPYDRADRAATPRPSEAPILNKPAMLIKSDHVSKLEGSIDQKVSSQSQEISTPLAAAKSEDDDVKQTVIVESPEGQTSASAPVTGSIGASSCGIEKKHPLQFTNMSTNKDPCDFDFFMFNVFNDYLQPNTKLSADDAAKCLDALLPCHLINVSNYPEIAELIPNNYQDGFSEEVLDYARQIPHDHESQTKLIQLMLAFKRLPVTEMKKNYLGEYAPYWRAGNWQGWNDCSRHAFGDTSPDARGPAKNKTRAQEYAEYTSINAFFARLEAAKIMPPDLEYALFSLSVAAGCASGVELSLAHYPAEIQPCYIVAGALWIEHAGELLWDEIRWGKIITTAYSHGSKAYEFPPSMWASLMKDFDCAATSDAEAKFWAAQAAKKMREIMVRHGYTVEDMLTWDPEKQTVHDGMLEDSRYAHLFQLPNTQASQASQASDKPEEARINVNLIPADLTIKKHPLKLTIAAIDEFGDALTPDEWTMFNILNDYLQPDTTLTVDEAAQCLDSLLSSITSGTSDDPLEESSDSDHTVDKAAQCLDSLLSSITSGTSDDPLEESSDSDHTADSISISDSVRTATSGNDRDSVHTADSSNSSDSGSGSGDDEDENDEEDENDDIFQKARGLLEGFGDILFKLLKQIPHDHESQDKVLVLLDAFKRLPSTHALSEEPMWHCGHMDWEDKFRWSFGDAKPRLKTPKAGMTHQEECEVYMSVHAFGARCVDLNWPQYNLIFNTLNDPLNPKDANIRSYNSFDTAFMSAHVGAAAQWILYAGEWLFGRIRWGKDQYLIKNPGRPSYRRLGPDVWVAWMRGYEALSSNTNDANVRFWARVLASKMREIMVGRGFNAKKMETWDPEKHNFYDGIREDARYAHLFKVPEQGGE